MTQDRSISSRERLALEDFLAPIRKAFGRDDPLQKTEVFSLENIPARISDGMDKQALRDLFIAEAEKVHVDVIRCAKDEVASAISGLISASDGTHPLVVSRDFPFHDLGLDRADLDFLYWDGQGVPEDNIALAQKADFSLTFSECAIAETATVVLTSDASSARSLSLLPLHHISVLYASCLVPTMGDYLRMWEKKCASASTSTGSCAGLLPSQICFVTGPSATSDIELVRVEGVHGPMYEHCVLIDDISSAEQV